MIGGGVIRNPQSEILNHQSIINGRDLEIPKFSI